MAHSMHLAHFALSGAPALVLCGGYADVLGNFLVESAVLMPGPPEAPRSNEQVAWERSPVTGITDISAASAIALALAQLQAQVALGRLLSANTSPLRSSLDLQEVAGAELSYWRLLGHFGGLDTIGDSFESASLKEALRPYLDVPAGKNVLALKTA